MECLEGETLEERLARGPLPLGEAIQQTLVILSTLETVHRRGLIHRDLKPANLFLTPHGLKLLDFGLARPIDPALAATAQMTQAGMVLGTPQYLAPESLQGQPVDARADLFAVGTVLYEMLTGQPPFKADSLAALVHAVTHERPPALTGSAAIAAVDRVIHRAMAKRPDDRYRSADAMLQARSWRDRPRLSCRTRESRSTLNTRRWSSPTPRTTSSVQTVSPWGLVGESVTANGTVENIELLLATAKRAGLPVFVSPHYYYPSDHGWQFGGAVETMMHAINMFDRQGALTTDGFEGIRGRLAGTLQALPGRRIDHRGEPAQGVWAGVE